MGSQFFRLFQFCLDESSLICVTMFVLGLPTTRLKEQKGGSFAL